MKPICRGRVDIALGRRITDAEAREIELRLTRSAGYLARRDPGWRSLAKGARFEAAARHAAAAADAEAAGLLAAFDMDFRLRQAGREAFGADFDRLEASGQLEFRDRAEDLGPQYAGDNDAMAVYRPDGGITVFRSMTSPDQMGAVLLHEAGAHKGLPGMLGRAGYERVLNAVDKLYASGDPAARAARRAVPEDTPDSHIRHEMLAYLVEAAPQAGPAKRAIAAAKAWAIRAFPRLAPLLADEATLRSLAAMAVRAAARREGRYSLAEALFAKTGRDSPLAVDETAARAAFERRLLHADPAFDAGRMDEAWAMHKAYRAAAPEKRDLLSAVPGENGPTATPAAELRKMDRMVERFRGCVFP